MVYSITYDAINTKITRFDPPSSLINMNELAAAICIGYRQADLPVPDITEGQTADEIRSAFLEKAEKNDSVSPKLITVIKDYPEGEHTVSADTLATWLYGKNM